MPACLSLAWLTGYRLVPAAWAAAGTNREVFRYGPGSWFAGMAWTRRRVRLPETDCGRGGNTPHMLVQCRITYRGISVVVVVVDGVVAEWVVLARR